jgi:hypothetical protein
MEVGSVTLTLGDAPDPQLSLQSHKLDTRLLICPKRAMSPKAVAV